MKKIARTICWFCCALAIAAQGHGAVYSWDTYKNTVLGVGWQPGDAVTIDGDTVYYYNSSDVNDSIDAVMGALTIQNGGAFYCNHPDRYDEAADVRTLYVESIAVTGASSKFECGSDPAIPASQSFSGTFELHFKEGAACQASTAASLNPMCQGFHVMDGADLFLFGNKGRNTWSYLTETNIPVTDAVADNQITVANVAGWQIHDEITIAASELTANILDPAAIQHFRIVNINGNVLTLDGNITRRVIGDAPYVYDTHNSLVYQYGDQNTVGTLANRYQQKLKDSSGNALQDQHGNTLLARILSKEGQPINTLDERTEVANRTRNIRLIGDQTAAVKNAQLGAHMMFMMAPGDIHVDGIEIINGGRIGQLGRYPFHWHWAFDSEGDFIRNAGIHDNFNRCITVHRTHNVRVENNVCINTIGHAYFLEDGDETGNRFIDNLAIQVTPPAVGTQLLESDVTFEVSTGNSVSGPAAYWISNPDNIFVGNGVSSAGSGYWFSFKDAEHSIAGTTAAMDTLFSVFADNRVHNTATGILFDGPPNGACMNNPRNPCTGGSVEEQNRSGDHDITPLNPGGNRYAGAGESSMVVVDGFTSYKATQFALWIQGENLMTATHLKLADSRVDMGLVFSQYITRSLVVGASPALSVAEHHGLNAGGALAGALLYDGPARFDTLHFAGYGDVDKPVIPFALFGAAADRTPQFARQLTFENTALPTLDFAHDISWKPKRRENWSTGLYVTDNSLGDYQFMVNDVDIFTDYSVRPDEPGDWDAISTFVSSNPLANDCVSDVEWFAETGRVIVNASVCPGHFGHLHFNGTMDALFKRISHDPDYPDVVFDHEQSRFGWGPIGKFSFPSALIQANTQAHDPSDPADLTYEITFKNGADYSVTASDPSFFTGNKYFNLEPLMMQQGEWSPWLVLVPMPYKACIFVGTITDDLRVVQPTTNLRVLRVRSRATVPDSGRDADGHYGLYALGSQDYAVPILCGPDTDEDGILNSVTPDDDGDGLDDATDTDDDNDGVPDSVDFYPGDPGGWVDTDGDKIGDNYDDNDDNDWATDVMDAFPLDPAEWLDTDGDSIGNNADWDDDNDGVPDTIDAAPLDAGDSSEITLPLDGNYKGSTLKDSLLSN